MSQRRELDHHLQSLSDIRDIMNSMKTLAYMETRKLARFIDAQSAVVTSIEKAVGDLLAWHPDILPGVEPSATAFLLIGSERGFCGDFNHKLLEKVNARLDADLIAAPMILAVGRKICSLLEDDDRVVSALDGASTVDEINTLLAAVVSQLTGLEEQYKNLDVFCVYHDANDDVVIRPLLPPFQEKPETGEDYSNSPLINLAPRQLFAELSEHYLFALLHQMFYASMYAENHSRVSHMESAVKHLDEKADNLAQRYNALRQEEITEEIEVILLNAANLETYTPKHKKIKP